MPSEVAVEPTDRRTGDSEAMGPTQRWITAPSDQQHRDRLPMVRMVAYETTSPLDPNFFEREFENRHGRALTINISSNGLLVLMEHAPEVAQVMRIHVPMVSDLPHIPTLVEVAWTRPVPLAGATLHFVGLKFVL